MAPYEKAVLALAAAALLVLPAVASAQEDLTATLAQAVPLFAFQEQGNDPALILLRSGGAPQLPQALVASRGGWRLVELPAELSNTAWAYAGRTLDNGEIWGLTEGTSDGQPYLYFVSSGNGGRGWRLRGYLRKISPFAVVDSFAMDKSGKGTLVLRLDEDPAPDAPRLGHYVYLTRNGGREWSEPMYSHGKPLPPSDVLARPDQTFEPRTLPEPGAWQRVLATLSPSDQG
jgi:hypothetical protein